MPPLKGRHQLFIVGPLRLIHPTFSLGARVSEAHLLFSHLTADFIHKGF